MNHTIPLDQGEMERRLANMVNAAVRHCRIGKVRMKSAGYPRNPFDMLPPYKVGSPCIWPFDRQQPVQWWQNPVVSTFATDRTH